MAYPGGNTPEKSSVPEGASNCSEVLQPSWCLQLDRHCSRGWQLLSSQTSPWRGAYCFCEARSCWLSGKKFLLEFPVPCMSRSCDPGWAIAGRNQPVLPWGLALRVQRRKILALGKLGILERGSFQTHDELEVPKPKVGASIEGCLERLKPCNVGGLGGHKRLAKRRSQPAPLKDRWCAGASRACAAWCLFSSCFPLVA